VKIIKQLARIVAGFFAATLTALLITLALHPLITGSSFYSAYFTFSAKEFLLVASVDWLFLATSVVVPALIAITIAEAIKIRSFIAHVVVGAVFGFLFTGYARNVAPWIDLSSGPALDLRESAVMIVAGVFAAIAYWHYAGKYAGMWRER
jgi:hypothetical protein